MNCFGNRTLRAIAAVLIAAAVLLTVGSLPESAAKKHSVKAEEDSGSVANRGFRDVMMAHKQKVSADDYGKKCFTIGDHGFLSFYSVNQKDAKKKFRIPAGSSEMGTDLYAGQTISYKNTDSSVIEIDEKEHTYRAVTGGSATVTMTMEYQPGKPGNASGSAAEPVKTASAEITFIVGADTSGVKVECDCATAYILDDINEGDATYQLLDCPELSHYNLSCESSNPAMEIEVGFSHKQKNALTLYTYNTGHSTVIITLNNCVLIVELTVVKAPINHSAYVLDQGKSVTLKIKKYPEKPVWHSSNEKVATVDANGRVKSKKVGNTIIYADIGGHRTGCIVSVVKKGIARVVKRATWIGDHWKYSQPRRMSKGYYDCSSLVWKAYRLSGRYICGARGYAPVAADIGKWCARRKRSLGAFKEKNIAKMKYLPGDVLLKVKMRGDRYRGIGHVEMITGYTLHGFIGKKPVLYLTWGARDEGYGASRKDDFVGRPYN